MITDEIALAFYELTYRVAFIEKTGDEFQDFFSSVMEKRYPADFMRVRPWGSMGDQKNDGYLRSKRMLFQVYAPNQMRSADCIAKINEDFEGALPYWEEHFDEWVFVHNSRIGLGPDVTRKLIELENAHVPMRVRSWGFEELRKEVLELSDVDLRSLLGPAPSRQGMISLGLSDLVPILEHIACLPPDLDPDLRPVSLDKIERNMLSNAVALLLRAGMSRADLVRKFFKLKPMLQDQIAESFRAEYARLRETVTSPDEIFTMLQRFAGGDIVPSPKYQSAILACLSFFFEECDIFDRPEDSGENAK